MSARELEMLLRDVEIANKDKEAQLSVVNSITVAKAKVFRFLLNLDFSSNEIWITSLDKKSFRADEPARIIGLTKVTYHKSDYDICIKVRFKDGQTNYIPVSRLVNYQIKSEPE